MNVNTKEKYSRKYITMIEEKVFQLKKYTHPKENIRFTPSHPFTGVKFFNLPLSLPCDEGDFVI